MTWRCRLVSRSGLRRRSKMAKLLKIIPRIGPACVMLFLVACRTGDSQTTQTQEARAHPATTQTREASAQHATTQTQLPDWIVNPPTLPPGRVGKNNCKFEFGHEGADWTVHPDAGCWEHEGPGGWTRQQFQKIHVPKLPQCNDRQADLTGIRVCRAGGKDQDSPCGGKTGPTGCAGCVANPTCHQ
jgi:hypothetical protein